MKDFLYLVANDLYHRFGNDLSHTIVLFPNKRASLFFNDYLAKIANQPVWSPQFMSITEFFSTFSPKQIADPIETVCRLYKHYVRLTKSEETLDNFYGWGEQLLADFDDVDKQMADASKLFADVKDYAQLEHFDCLDDEQAELLKRFSGDFKKASTSHLRSHFERLWKVMLPLYQSLREELAAEGLAYEGQLFREVAENWQNGHATLPEHISHIAVVGFNAIDRAEHTVFSRLRDSGKGLFYWDYDTWYVNPDDKDSRTQEAKAGFFLEKNLSDFPNALVDVSFSNFESDRAQRSMEFVNASTETIQAESVRTWLTDPQNYRPDQARRTAVVLCNEALLQPVIQALPAHVKEANITKGFPFTHTPIFAMISKLMEETEREDDRKEATQGTKTRQDTPAQRLRACKAFLDRLTEVIDNESKHIDDLTDKVKREDGTEQRTPEGELLYQLYTESYYQAYTITQRFQQLLTGTTDTETPRESVLDVTRFTLCRLMRKVMSNVSIPFHGEPAVGLQIMGVLETRCLDFDNLLLLSVNEGVLPQKGNDTSFIPFLVKKMHGLTTPDRRVSVYAYYFYRLIQRAQHVRLVYNNSTEGTQKGEMSRFMQALLVEGFDRFHIQRMNLVSTPIPPNLPDMKPLHVPLVEGKKRRPLFTQLSPSAVKVYFTCPRKFYFHYIMHLKGSQTQDPIINANDFGTVFHEAADKLLTEELHAKDNFINASTLKQYLEDKNCKAKLEGIVKKAFVECAQQADSNIQQTPITVEALTNYLKKLLQYETGALTDQSAAADKLHIIHNEAVHSVVLPIPFFDGNQEITVPFTFKGYIDRFDEAILPDGTQVLRVIDYKTGKDKTSATSYKFDDFFSVATGSKKYPENPMQIFIYSLMITKTTLTPVQPMLFYIPSLAKRDFAPFTTVDGIEITNFHQIADEFEQRLIETVATLINPDTEFPPNPKRGPKEHCEYCEYRTLCKL